MSFKLINGPSVVIYDRNRVIIQATGVLVRGKKENYEKMKIIFIGSVEDGVPREKHLPAKLILENFFPIPIPYLQP